MKVENIPRYIRAHLHSDLIVEFDDGDRYRATALDLEDHTDGTFISTSFENCFGKSNSYALAMETGFPTPEGCWWTSDSARKPIGMHYSLDRIKSGFGQ
jgi:hypothetical protein